MAHALSPDGDENVEAGLYSGSNSVPVWMWRRRGYQPGNDRRRVGEELRFDQLSTVEHLAARRRRSDEGERDEEGAGN